MNSNLEDNFYNCMVLWNHLHFCLMIPIHLILKHDFDVFWYFLNNILQKCKRLTKWQTTTWILYFSPSSFVCQETYNNAWIFLGILKMTQLWSYGSFNLSILVIIYSSTLSILIKCISQLGLWLSGNNLNLI